MTDQKELFRLVRRLTGDDIERENIYGIVDLEIFDIDSLSDIISMRLVEKGCQEAIRELAGRLYSPYPEIRERCADSVRYDGCVISPKVLYVVGQYLDQLYGYKRHPVLLGNPNSMLYKIRSKISKSELPEKHYFSWALQNALNDEEALAVAP
ncbi:hypothetical protein BCR32DRAFT_327209 [Anaeromyces robustus]|uniref:Uncharacterized protein n=1 Tax=Anaeromyces robustus TaxID=1754192 RepID=A0A1Y1X7D3_9FUNG|nr:hypothetical protein BCR32DRAFT_327209 [Anaeromyces robustus]|eukprot:ORX81679.1 hypothetical protein BCR32DRAFT_327209 [Anaeromyces robustus]